MYKRKMQIGLLLTAVALIAVVAFGGLASAADRFVAQIPTAQGTPTAQPKQSSPHPIRLSGTVSSVSSGSLVLATKQTNYTINVGADTWIVVAQSGKAVQGNLSDVVAGKPVVIAGMTTNDPAVVDARVISQGKLRNALGPTRGSSGLPGARGRLSLAQFAAAGTITGIDSTTITLKGAVASQVIVHTTPQTVILNNGFSPMGSLKVGDSVQVLGQPVKSAGSASPPPSTSNPGSTNHLPAGRTINAWAVRVINASSQVLVGHVTAVSGNTLTVETHAGKNVVTITVNSSTGYKTVSKANKAITVASGSLADVTAGSNVIMEATQVGSSNSYTADAVIVLPGTKKPK